MTTTTKLYEISTDSGKPSLVLAPTSILNEPAEKLLQWCEDAVRRFAAEQDGIVLYEIAAGAAAEIIFARRLHRRVGKNQEDYCQLKYNRDARTIRDWRKTAQAYEDIGGLEARVQPTAFSQVLTLTKLRRDRRREGWGTISAENGGTSPTGKQITEWARKNAALLRTPKNANQHQQDAALENSSLPPITTPEEAHACLQNVLERTDQFSLGKARSQLLGVLAYLDAQLPTNGRTRGTNRTTGAITAPGQLEMFTEAAAEKTDAA